MSNGWLLLIRLSICAALSAALGGAGYLVYGRAGLFLGLLFAAPLFATAMAKPLVEFGAQGWTWLARSAAPDWDGHYYAFNNVQVRVDEEGERLALAGIDACRATETPLTGEMRSRIARLSCGELPGTRVHAIPWQSMDLLLRDSPSREAGRFQQWLRREVVAPWHKKRGLPFEVHPPRPSE